MTERKELGIGAIFLTLAGFLVVGVPLVAMLWGAANDVAAGHLGRLVIVLPLLVVLAAFLVVFGRRLSRLESHR